MNSISSVIRNPWVQSIAAVTIATFVTTLSVKVIAKRFIEFREVNYRTTQLEHVTKNGKAFAATQNTSRWSIDDNKQSWITGIVMGGAAGSYIASIYCRKFAPEHWKLFIQVLTYKI